MKINCSVVAFFVLLMSNNITDAFVEEETEPEPSWLANLFTGSEKNKREDVKTFSFPDYNRETDACSLDHEKIFKTERDVDITVKLRLKQESEGLVRLTFNEGEFTGLVARGWCIDLGRSIGKGNYDFDVYSSLDKSGAIPSSSIEKKNAVDKPENLPALNWLMNTIPTGTVVPSIPDCTTTDHMITDQEYQLATWFIIDSIGDEDEDKVYKQWKKNGKHEEDKCVVDWLIEEALKNGLKNEAINQPDYEPDCYDSDGKIGFLLVVDNDDKYEIVDENYKILKQVLLAEIDVRHACTCVPVGSSPTEAPISRGRLTSAPIQSSTTSPTKSPTGIPTKLPTANPTRLPTRTPTSSPTNEPTKAPTGNPTKLPTGSPTGTPTRAPTSSPTNGPTKAPTGTPTKLPTGSPTGTPTRALTSSPTRVPTKLPTSSPTNTPTNTPTLDPTPQPTTPAPTKAPSRYSAGGTKTEPTEAPTKATPTPTKAPSIYNPGSTQTESPNAEPSIFMGASGDPHFKTWTGEYYDFHGICDLILLSNPNFNDDLGMDIYIRSKKTRQWSYISTAAIRIGVETFEVSGRKDGDTHWINGIKGDGNGDDILLEEGTKIAGYPITYQRVHSTQREYVIDLGENDNKIVFKTWKDFVRVDVVNPRDEDFNGSLGLMGSYPDGKSAGRFNSSSSMKDRNAFGQEWQVLPSDPKLFHSIEGPQYPARCELPSKSALRRRLSKSEISREDAETLCSNISNKEERDLCAFDVMATSDKAATNAY